MIPFSMRILVLTTNVDLPESHIFVGLAERGVEFVICCDKESPNREFLISKGFDVRDISLPSRFSLSAIKHIRTLVGDGNFDIIHSYNSRALTNALFATSKHKKAKHVTYRGTVGHLGRLDPTSWLSFFHPRLSKIVCVSNAVRKYLLSKNIDPKKLVTIYKGHNIRWYQESETLSLTEFGIPSGSFVICCAATMRPVKGVSVLLEAFTKLTHLRDVHLLLIGNVKDPKIKDIYKDSKAVHFTGFRRDVAKFLKATDLFVMPSLAREGLPKAAIEAMCLGVPPIVSDVGGLPELVENNVSGLVIAPGDSTALARAIEKLYTDQKLRVMLGTNAVKQIQNKFSVEHSIEQTHALYLELVS